ncbi:MAG: helix-turn-helix domain-containing protein [Pseudolysinimonas sp.]|uniref:TetR/AcrR family transcriptional regulator n=1 Tax=Pseudolysinimonas sp. TaxID=2680009 RepID=UPI003265FFED
MGRWEPGARDRIADAALELFTEGGFAATTVPQITARAGLTTRTFFRHFADKRDVLFADEDEIPLAITGLLAVAPLSTPTIEVIGGGLRGLVSDYEPRRDQLRARLLIIQSDDSLRERYLRKLSVMSAAMVAGFRQRGTDGRVADVAAKIGSTLFGFAYDRWLATGETRSLSELIDETLDLFGSEFAASTAT